VKIVNVEAHSLTVELDITDSIALAHAARAVAARDLGGDYPLLDALAGALVGGAFGAFLLAECDPPQTLRHMWEMWAPYDTSLSTPRRLPLPERFAPLPGEPRE